MTTMELMTRLKQHAHGLRTPDVRVYDTDGHEFDIVEVYEEDGLVCIDVRRQDVS